MGGRLPDWVSVFFVLLDGGVIVDKLDLGAVVNWYNAAVGAAVALLSTLFGQFWYLFAAFLLLNIIDWLTGWAKARKLKKESSYIGLRGLIKKLGYWVLIVVAFLMAAVLSALGSDILQIDLDFLLLLGWFTLASLLVNEIRSILENLVEMGYEVPAFLVKGLAVTEQLINAGADVKEKE